MCIKNNIKQYKNKIYEKKENLNNIKIPLVLINVPKVFLYFN